MIAAGIYDILIFFSFLLYLPVIIWRMVVQGKYRVNFAQRFGYLGTEQKQRLRRHPIIWMHAVSVGETVAAAPIVTELKKRHPSCGLVFTTVTDTGQEVARKIIKGADVIAYLPVDLPGAVRRFVKAIKPDMLVLTESEFWPNLIRITKSQGASVILANGRISDRSFKRYRYLGPIWRQTLQNIDRFCMQSDYDVARIISLGAAPDRVVCSGNTKFDQLPAIADEQTQRLKREFGLLETDIVWVVGSTHPGEEEQVLQVYQALQNDFSDLVLILAPRHIERIEEVARLFSTHGIKTIRRTELYRRNAKKHRVILVDTIGELVDIYGLGDLVFVGGSLVPRGGHNILEPASLGKPVLFGPYMFNFVSITDLVLQDNAAIQIEDKKELVEQLRKLLRDEQKREEFGRRVKEVVEKNRGAAKRVVNVIEKHLNYGLIEEKA